MITPFTAEQYRNLQSQAHWPPTAQCRITSDEATFSDLFLNLADVVAQLQSAQNETTTTRDRITVYADVLYLPANFVYQLPRGVLAVYARCIQCEGGATLQLALDEQPESTILLISQQIDPNLSISARLSSSGSVSLAPAFDPLHYAGVQLGLVRGEFVATPCSMQQSNPLSPNDDIRLAINEAFLLGSVILDQQPEMALSLFSWVTSWSAIYPDFADLTLRSQSLQILLKAKLAAAAQGGRYVPAIAVKDYVGLASALKAEAAQVEANYLALSGVQSLTNQNIALAKTMCTAGASQIALLNAQIARAQQDYQDACAAVSAATANIQKQNFTIKIAQGNFKNVGLEKYKDELILKSCFDIATALGQITVSLGLMAVGDVAAAAPAAGGVAAAAGAAEEGVEMVEMGEAMEQMAHEGEAVAEAAQDVSAAAKEMMTCVDDLKRSCEIMQKLFELSKTLYEQSEVIKSAVGKQDPTEGEPSPLRPATADDAAGLDLPAGDSWAIYRLKMDDLMQASESKGIEFATEYREAMDTLAICGQSLATSQLAAVHSQQALAQLQLQRDLAVKQQAEVSQYATALTEGGQMNACLLQMLYWHYLDAKTGLFTVLQNYRAAYFYWALQESSVQSSLASPVASLASSIASGGQELSEISQDKITALTALNPMPQAMTDRRWETSNPDILKALQTTGNAMLVIGLDDPAFSGLQRVRVDTVRVWLEGAVGAISLSVRTSGLYRDRFQGESYLFATAPLQEGFAYTVGPAGSNVQNGDWVFDDGSVGHFSIDGRRASEVATDYLDPTPFTEWMLSLDLKKVDLTNLSRISLQFSGSVIFSSQLL